MNGFDYILAHTAFDLQGCIGAPLEALKIIQDACRCAKAGISGVIYLKGLQEICAAKQDGIVVGGGLINADAPAGTARMLKMMMKETE